MVVNSEVSNVAIQKHLSQNLLATAIRYAAELGWYVFPTREVDSEPFEVDGKLRILKMKSPYTRNGFNDASRNIENIKYWWKRFPTAGIGVLCGKSGLTVVDIDTKDGRQGYENWTGLALSDAGAWHSVTPSGGVHIIFSGVVNTRANAQKGVDIRSRGGYIVAPPSKLFYPNGELVGQYTMLEDWFSSSPPVKFPNRLMDAIDSLRGIDPDKRINKPKRIRKMSRSQKEKAIIDALNVMPIEYCDQYNDWITIGLAIKWELGDDGFEVWNEWSKKVPTKYDRNVCEYKWSIMEPRGEVTMGTIRYYAYQKSGV